MDIVDTKTVVSHVSLEDFLRLLGEPDNVAPPAFVDSYDQELFAYRNVTESEHEQNMIDILRMTLNEQHIQQSQNSQAYWEGIWQQVREVVETNPSSKDGFVPIFFKMRGVRRYCYQYIKPTVDGFLRNYIDCLRRYLYMRYLSEVDNVYEFGCGSGHNLQALAQVYSNKSLVGLDWTKAACGLVDALAHKQALNLRSQIFNMYQPDAGYTLADNSAVLTHGALEQLGSRFDKILDYWLEQKPKLCIHVEPIIEFYDQTRLFDYLAAVYHQRRNYLSGFYPTLQAYAKRGRLEIIKAQHMQLGSFLHDGMSVIVWRPI